MQAQALYAALNHSPSIYTALQALRAGLCLGVESKAAHPTLHTRLVYQHKHLRIWQSATATARSYPRFALPVSPGLFGITPATFVSPGAKARAAPLPAGRPSTRSRNGRCSGAKGSARHCCGGHGCRQGRLVHRAQHNVARSGPVAEGGRGPLPGPLKVPGAEAAARWLCSCVELLSPHGPRASCWSDAAQHKDTCCLGLGGTLRRTCAW